MEQIGQDGGRRVRADQPLGSNAASRPAQMLGLGVSRRPGLRTQKLAAPASDRLIAAGLRGGDGVLFTGAYAREVSAVHMYSFTSGVMPRPSRAQVETDPVGGPGAFGDITGMPARG